ncbi:hypothetical protein GYA19_05930 [Candidatus Beckwithbacteria bacterium]|nr:hypothetical protein [Candidatus Beckwithbacteria bacterium]
MIEEENQTRKSEDSENLIEVGRTFYDNIIRSSIERFKNRSKTHGGYVLGILNPGEIYKTNTTFKRGEEEREIRKFQKELPWGVSVRLAIGKAIQSDGNPINTGIDTDVENAMVIYQFRLEIVSPQQTVWDNIKIHLEIDPHQHVTTTWNDILTKLFPNLRLE